MEDIHTLHYNDFGIAFQWKRNMGKNIYKIQLVFRETGLFLTPQELIHFKKQVLYSLEKRATCNDCSSKSTCRSLLLETPFNSISFAVSKSDLKLLLNLIEGTLFNLSLNGVLSTSGIQTS